MQTVSCPSCGAEVHFRSHASVMAVCEYCSTRVLKEADAVRDLGRMSAVLEDYSPIQLGTAGVLGGRRFNVVGRIQLRYAAGMWNEWYLLFDDGADGWLGDASGQYSVTTAMQVDGGVPDFGELAPGKMVSIGEGRYMTADVRTAECVGGQGELPFKAGEGWQAKVADFRSGAVFVTLDYSDGPQAQAYSGAAVTLDSLQCQLLRDDDEIKRSAGRYRGKLDALDCPSCGSPINYVPGVTASLVCPACSAQIDAAAPQAQVLAAGAKVDALPTTLKLGATAKMHNQDYRLIGLMVRADDDGEEWTEYLLYAPRAGFTWLVETAEGWSRANAMTEWPTWHSTVSQTARLDKVDYDLLYQYGSTVRHAAGAFNWRVQAGDRARVHEFGYGQVKLAAELTQDELAWSRSAPVAFDQIKAWFGSQVPGKAAPQRKSRGGYRGVAGNFIMAMMALNAIPLLFSFSGTVGYSLIGAIAIYLPAWLLDVFDKHPS